MPTADSWDLRTRILKDCDHGMSSEETARKDSVSITWADHLKKHRKDVAEKRADWQEWPMSFDITNLVFLNETWTKTNRTPHYGWWERGQRLIDDAPLGHWKTTTCVGALRQDDLTAPMGLDGAIHGD